MRGVEIYFFVLCKLDYGGPPESTLLKVNPAFVAVDWVIHLLSCFACSKKCEDANACQILGGNGSSRGGGKVKY